jgi:hypothetical protein
VVGDPSTYAPEPAAGSEEAVVAAAGAAAGAGTGAGAGGNGNGGRNGVQMAPLPSQFQVVV